MKLTLEQTLEVRSHARQNHAEISRSNACRCINCRGRFAPEDIVEWVGSAGDGIPGRPGALPKKRADIAAASAVCPLCGSWEVIGDASGLPLNDAEFWKQI
ncbi:hypothetical protein SAMN03159338_1921 [Sphingomonas sp. NFR04]|nr:hypothetical protein SAMN03159338_1921 [Sphingomonas sp. NFR04]